MSIIFGEINHSGEFIHPNYPEIEKVLFWEKAGYHKWSGSAFQIGIFSNKNQNLKSNHFFSQDKEEGLYVWLIGQIYNHSEIQDKHLNNQNISDLPTLVLELFKKAGTSFVDSLNGDFSIIIVNEKKKKSFLFRDHMGVKPLAFAIQENSLFFSSDFASLSKGLFPGTPIDKDFIVQHIQDYNYIDYKKTTTSGVVKLLPAHYAIFDSSGLKQKKYWFPESIKINKKIDADSALETLKLLTSDAVKIRVNKKVSTGAHISGGLDSGLVAVLARKEKREQESFFGFSWTNPATGEESSMFNERDLIREIEKKSNTKTVYCEIIPEQYWKQVRDFPSYSFQIYENAVLNEALKRNVKEIFSGWGGDEFLSINNRGVYFDLVKDLNWKSLIKNKPVKNIKAFTGMLLFHVLLPFLSLAYLKRRPGDQWSYHFFHSPFNKRPERNKTLFNYKSRRDVHLSLLYNYHISGRTEIWDLLGSKVGIDYRYPLLDKRIVEFVLTIPSKVLANLPSSRPLIREISKGFLPEKVRMHQSKLDSARLNYLLSFYKETVPFFLTELNEIKENPDLDFLNFEEIEAECRIIESQPDLDHEFDFLIFLNKVKAIHEFTKSYRNNS